MNGGLGFEQEHEVLDREEDIDKVMYTQETLVEVQGRFIPRIVRMNKE